MAVVYRATEPCVLVKLDNRQTVYVYQGGQAPSNGDPADLERLVNEGYLQRIGDPDKYVGPGSGGTPNARPASGMDLGGVTNVISTDPHGRAMTVEVDNARLPGDDETGTQTVYVSTDADPNSIVPRESGEPRRPNANASKAAWVDFAVSQRDHDTSEEDARAEAEAMTKEQLVAQHGRR